MGKRVGAILSSDKDTVNFLGWGEYIGDEIPSVDSGGILALLHENGVSNPCIVLDSGKKVYGCECWWGSVEKIKESIGNKELIEIDIDDVRKEKL